MRARRKWRTATRSAVLRHQDSNAQHRCRADRTENVLDVASTMHWRVERVKQKGKQLHRRAHTNASNARAMTYILF